MSAIHSNMTPEEELELNNFTALETDGYILRSAAHEVIKGDENSETDIWSKNDTFYMGTSLETLKPFNGYAKHIFRDGKDIGTVVIDHDDKNYSLETVLLDVEEFLGDSNFELRTQQK